MSDKVIAIFFGQYGPYHHARVSALQNKLKSVLTPTQKASLGRAKVIAVQISASTLTYKWSANHSSQANPITLCSGIEENILPINIFLKTLLFLLTNKVDVAFLPSYSPSRYFCLYAAAKVAGIRTVMMNESHAGTERATGIKKLLKSVLVKGFDAALVGGTPHKRHFEKLGIPSRKIFTGYDAVDNEYFSSKAIEIRNIIKSIDSTANYMKKGKKVIRPYGLPDRYFLSLGRMVKKKNLPLLISAYSDYITRVQKIISTNKSCDILSLVLVGSGDQEDQLIHQALELGVSVVDKRSSRMALLNTSLENVGHQAKPSNDNGTIYFYGFRQIDENPIFYSLADAFILPSLHEEWGLVVNEAMACSLPIIVSQVAGCSEDLLPNTQNDSLENNNLAKVISYPGLQKRCNGYLFDPKSKDALTEALFQISKCTKSQLIRMGLNSFHIIDKFSCNNFAEQALSAASAAILYRNGSNNHFK